MMYCECVCFCWPRFQILYSKHCGPFVSPSVLQTSTTMRGFDDKLKASSAILILASFINCFVNGATIQVTNKHSGLQAYKQNRCDMLSKMIVVIHLCVFVYKFSKALRIIGMKRSFQLLLT
jgi:hypothetical protein